MRSVPLPDFDPLKKSKTDLDIERTLLDTFMAMLREYLRPQERTLAMYAFPDRAPIDTLELFVKTNGLSLYRADIPNIEPYIRHLYRVTKGLHPTGELGLLGMFLQVLFPNQYRIVRLWHRTDPAYAYPTGILDFQMAGVSFLTSRINVYIDPDSLNAPFAGRVLAALNAVVGFEIVLKVYLQAPAVPEELEFLAIVDPFTVLGLEDQDNIDMLGSYTT